MTDKVVAVIPARGGSKGLPGKNIKLLSGIPLIAWTINAALNSDFIDRVIVNTDCDKIASIAKEYGAEVPFMRPSELATDTASSIDVVEHVLDSLNETYDYVLLLQPTSPFRNTYDIDSAISLAMRSQSGCVVSVCLTEKSPYWMYRVDEELQMEPVIDEQAIPARRQDAGAIYQLNGAIYISEVDRLYQSHAFLDSSTLAYVMPVERSIDIDTEIDFKIAEYLSEKIS